MKQKYIKVIFISAHGLTVFISSLTVFIIAAVYYIEFERKNIIKSSVSPPRKRKALLATRTLLRRIIIAV